MKHIKKTLFLLTLLLSIETLAKDYVVVGVAGFGTGRPGEGGQISGVHDFLPNTAYAAYKLVHYAKDSELQEVIDEFKCTAGIQQKENLGLIIMANSWGAGNAVKLADMYSKQCGNLTELFVMIEGIGKFFDKKTKSAKVKRCINYYQTKDIIRGNEMDGCENIDMTYSCTLVGGLYCHVEVEWNASIDAKYEIIRNYLY